MLIRDHTKNEFLGRSKHVQREGDFVLVALALQPADEGGDVEHLDRVVGVDLKEMNDFFW